MTKHSFHILSANEIIIRIVGSDCSVIGSKASSCEKIWRTYVMVENRYEADFRSAERARIRAILHDPR